MIDLLKAGVFDSTIVFKDIEKTPERLTDIYEIELYVYGEGESYIDSALYRHEKGNLIFIKPGQKRFSRNRFICFYLHLNIDKETAGYFKNVPPVIKASDYQLYKSLYIEIIRLYESSFHRRPMLIQSKIYELLDMILNDAEINLRLKNSSTKTAPEIIQKAIAFINENYSRQLALKDIAAGVNFSPSYFHKIFSEFVGKTPHDFLLEKRLETAKTYLLTTDYSIDEIINRCAFSSHSYFDCAFKNAYGITPSEFRKRKFVL